MVIDNVIKESIKNLSSIKVTPKSQKSAVAEKINILFINSVIPFRLTDLLYVDYK